MDRIIITLIVYFSILNNFCRTDNSTYDKTPFRVFIPMRFIDQQSGPKDIFFDRIVYISMNIHNYSGDGRQQKHISLGVFIDEDRIITSYNPFRGLINKTEELKFVRACFIEGRRFYPASPGSLTYRYKCHKITCGRPLIPIKDSEVLPDQWHGIDKKHSPLHDLMILKIDEPVTFWTPDREYTFEELYTKESIDKGEVLTIGPTLIKLASGNVRIGESLKFAALGLYNLHDAHLFIRLTAAYYEEATDVLVRCDEWLPKSWGYFICLLNDERFVSFSSGAMLFSNDMLYGVGSFTLWRDKASIIVFTDVRYYTELMVYTCTDIDLE